MSLFLIPLIVTLLGGFTRQDSVRVIVPSVEQETDYLWRTLRDLPTLDRFGYQVSLPGGDIMESIIQSARAEQLSDADYEVLLNHMRDNIYSPDDYRAGFKKVTAGLERLDKMVDQLKSSSFEWPFKQFDRYDVVLTLYGPGGSYDPEYGSILLFTTRSGQFKQYDDPACTIMHEIIHIGIEESIVNRYEVPHPMKERIVDTFVTLYFKDQLPDYRIQNMGDYRIDSHLTKREDLFKLGESVAIILGEK